jgi:hypothetical protein
LQEELMGDFLLTSGLQKKYKGKISFYEDICLEQTTEGL